MRDKLFIILLLSYGAFFLLFHPDYGNLGNWYREWQYENRLYERVSERADIFRYGENKDVDQIIRLQAEAEGWSFSGPQQFELIRTKNNDAPYVLSTDYFFVDPNDRTRAHWLQGLYVFDNYHDEWVPMISSLDEYSATRTPHLREIYKNVLWRGDFKIPFF